MADIAIPVTALGLSIVVEGFGRLVYAGVPAAVIVWIAVKTERWTSRYGVMQRWRGLATRPYSIYLVQVIALPAIGKLVVRFLPRISGDVIILIAVVLVVATGVLIYSVIERPLLKSLQAVFLPRVHRAPLSASVT